MVITAIHLKLLKEKIQADPPLRFPTSREYQANIGFETMVLWTNLWVPRGGCRRCKDLQLSKTAQLVKINKSAD